MLDATADAGVDISAVRRLAGATGPYTAVLDADGELVAAVSDMAVTEQLGPAHVDAVASMIAGARLVVLDGNLAAPTLDRAAGLAHHAGVPVVIEPVSVPKARLLAPLLRADRPVFVATPNEAELTALGGLVALHERGVECVWVRRGADGSTFADGLGTAAIAAVPVSEVLDVTGAGDAMLAGSLPRTLGRRDPGGGGGVRSRCGSPHGREPAHRSARSHRRPGQSLLP